MQTGFKQTTYHDFRERAKLENRHSETEEEHLSQPSTMHSLGNLEEHSSPLRDTPKSSKVHQSSHQIKHEAQVQIGSIRHMLKRAFGEKVDTARDNDQKTKQAVKNVNQEILQLPNRSEQVIESIGKGSGKAISSHTFPGHGLEKLTEIRDKVAQYMPQVREGAHLFVSVARSHLGEIRDNFLSSFNWADSISPSVDLSPSIKEQLNKVNEDIRKLPRKNERVIESMGQAQSEEEKAKKEEKPVEPQRQPQEYFTQSKEEKSQSQFKESSTYQSNKGTQVEQSKDQSESKKPDEKDLWDMAFHKIEEMKEKAHQKGQEFKHEAEKASQKSFERNEESEQQKTPEHQDFQNLHHEHHHLSAQSPSFEPHHLSAQSPSFQSTEHSRELAQTVKAGLTDNTVPLTKKVEEVESHWKQEEGQGHSLKQGAQELKSKISEKVGELKQSIQQGEHQKEREPLLDKIMNSIHAMSDNIHHTLEDIKDSFKVEERTHDYEPFLDKFMGEINKFSDNMRQKKPSYEPQTDENDIASMLIRNLEKQGIQLDENTDEKDIARMLIRNLEKQGIQLDENTDQKDIACMLVRNLNLGKTKFGRNITGESIEEITFTLYEDHSIKERIQERIHNISDKIRRKSVGEAEEINFTLYEDHSIKERIQEKIHNISDKIRRKSVDQAEEITFTLYEDHSIKERIQEKIHQISDKVRRKSAGQAEEITFTLYEDHSLKGRIEESIHHISDEIKNARAKLNTLEHDMPDMPEGKPEYDIELKQRSSGLRAQARNLKDFITRKQKQENFPEGYHTVATGFSKTVQEYLHEKKYIGPLKSQNPFEALGAEVDEADEPENLNEVLPDQPPYDISASQSRHSLPHRIKESFTRIIAEIKRRLSWRHKESFEEAHPLVPMEIQGEEEYEEEPQFDDDDEHPSKGKIRQSLEGFSSKISHDIDVMKGKFRSKKQELSKIQEKKETIKEKIVEEVQPVSQKIQNIETIKQDLPTTKQAGGIGLQHTKHQKRKAKTPKSASKAYPSENVALKQKGPSSEGFHSIVSGFSKSVAEFKKELRGPPLVSSNPFGGLVAGTTPRRKVSFQEPQQQKKKVYRLSQSAGKEAKKKRFEDFHKITSGFSESVAHFQREVRGDPLISDNPFEPLSTRNVNLSQPLDHNQVVGGHLDELTTGVTSKTFNFPEKSAKKKSQGSAKKEKKLPGTDITNKTVGESHVKALIQKTKGEIHGASNKIAGKIQHAKDKVKSVFHAEDKENVAQTA